MPLWNNSILYSQQFIDELKAKLPRVDQYKILKAETFNKKGRSFIEKGGPSPDSAMLTRTNLTKKEEESIDNYYTDRIKASYCFRDANGLMYYVLDKYIKTFWKRYKGNKAPFDLLIKVENAAYDSLMIADKLREKAEGEEYIADKVPIVSTAEAIEEKALFRLEKLLFIYMNWPESPNIPWLFSEDKTDPRLPKEVMLASIQLDLDSAKKDTVHKAMRVYNMSHISENQTDTFNEFQKISFLGKVSKTGIDFQNIRDNVVDSLHRNWNQYAFGQTLGSDDNSVNLFSGANKAKTKETHMLQESDRLMDTRSGNLKRETDQETISESYSDNVSNTGLLFKVQISASRKRLSAQELQKIYSGSEKIVESSEDNWFKYTLGSFTQYQRAFELKSSSHVRGSFVVAYFNGTRVKITKAMAKQKSN